MPTRLLPRQHLLEFFNHVGEHRRLIGPVAEGTTHNFRMVDDPADIDLDYTMTVLPPSKWIYRNEEPLLSFKVRIPSSARMPNIAEPVALIGVHPCDIHAIRVLDETLSDQPADTAYLERRKRTLIIGYQCQGPCGDYAFCFDKGTHLAQIGFDIMMSRLEHGYVVESGTEQGEDVLQTLDLLKNLTFHDRQELARVREDSVRKHRNRINGDLAKLAPALRDSIDGLIWQVVGKKCFSCGACNMVCPTCYCFDVQDEVDCRLCEGQRIRIWDACQAHNFAVVASGENFRPHSPERNMHRIFKKEVYVYDKYEMSACVGCGRCNRACIAGINLVEIYNQVLGA